MKIPTWNEKQNYYPRNFKQFRNASNKIQLPKKNLNITTSFRKSKSYGAESNIMKRKTKLLPSQGSSLSNFGKIQLFLITTRTMEQKELLIKPFK